jgi:ankyrin repeat protein
MSDATRRAFLSRVAACSGLGAVALAGCAGSGAPGSHRGSSLRGAGAAIPGDPAISGDSTVPERVLIADSATTRAFLTAVREGREPEVRRLLGEQSALASATDPEGRSALVLAVCAGHAPVVAALLEHEPFLGLIDALMIGDWDRAMELAEGDPAALDAYHPVGGTALYAAARAGHGGLYRLQLLGADLNGNPRGRLGVTPAYGALECASPTRALCSCVELLSNGAHVNSAQRGGDSLLHAAARRGELPIVRYLLRRGADVQALDARGRSSLRLAEEHGHTTVVELLRHPERVPRDDMTSRYAWNAEGQPVVWPDLSGLTREDHNAVTSPAHFSRDQVHALVGPDPRRAFCRSSQDELAVEASGHTGYREGAHYLLDLGVPMSLCTALSVGDLGRARAILRSHPGAIHERGPHDFAPMFYAGIGGGSVEAAELLLEHGCDVDQESQGTTGLHHAAMRGHLDLVAYLLEKGAQLDAVGLSVDRGGWTPLQAARERGTADVVRLLEQRGAT